MSQAQASQQDRKAACLPPGPQAAAVVTAALAMAAHLFDCPPSGLDACYDAGFPAAALAYWAQTCPGCSQWQNGNLQCVMFVGAAYALAGLPLPAMGNAIAFWSLYAGRAGWMEIPAGAAPPGARGLPAPGDLMVWYSARDPTVGHIAIVIGVQPPTAAAFGAVTFAEANGPGPTVTETLLPDLLVATWSGYTVMGYIRPS